MGTAANMLAAGGAVVTELTAAQYMGVRKP
jgi:hypothetical protein